MKKILIAVLCISMMIFGMSVPALAEATADFRIAKVNSTAETVDVPVYLTAIPDVVENVMSIGFAYSYDTSVLEYVSTTPGTASGTLFAASDGAVSWADATDLATGTAKITVANVGKENPLFTITFKVIDKTKTYTDIKAEKVELSAGNLLPDDVFEIVKLSYNNFNAVSGRIVFSDDPAAGDNDSSEGTDDENAGPATPGGSSGSGGNGTTDGENGDNTTENENGDDTTGDNNDDTTGGENTGNDNTTNTPDTPEGGDEESSGENGSNGGSGNAGGIKPNTGGTNNGSSGGSSGSKPSGGNSSFGGGIAVLPQTPPATETENTKPSKASDVFSDVADDHWAAQYALVLYNGGIVSGDSQKRANLENKITREETSKLALLVNGIEADASLALDVADASKVSDWAKSFMATAIKEGIFSGYEDGTVRPLNQITREEMVTVIIKSLKIDVDAASTVSFADGSEITWSAPYVAKAVELGFVNGYSDNTFKPGNAITRAEAFTIFARVLEYKNK